MNIYLGIDIGSCTTKVVAINQQGDVTASHVRRSGVDYQAVVKEALNAALGYNCWNGIPIVSTGYGRHSINFASEVKTEIACHAKGAFHFAQKALTIVDIGGQDSKVIRIDDQGRRLDFKMNRKCAAGTGTFI